MRPTGEHRLPDVRIKDSAGALPNQDSTRRNVPTYALARHSITEISTNIPAILGANSFAAIALTVTPPSQRVT
jgi:hypothetical protein